MTATFDNPVWGAPTSLPCAPSSASRSRPLKIVGFAAYQHQIIESAMQGVAPDAASTGCRQPIDGSAVWTFRDQLLSSDR